ncbi:GntR family transcriptional regulator [Ureibacillus sp. GCM10028918]|uniref:GntR family transcriptional regulator n=1 Tax=Ureibacillus sp. GCM10028918 TaxID=3273429 RepID=UPI00361936EA
MSSLAVKAYEEIRRKIIYAEFLPGEILSENNLSKELDMSRTPIRDALLRLDSEGFIKTLKNRGVLVKELSYKEILDILALNNCMNLYAVDLVSKGVTSFDIEKLQLHLDLQLKATENDDYLGYTLQSILFGRTLIESSQNEIMLKTYDSLRDKTLQFAMVGWKLKPKAKHYSANDFNTRILQAIISKEYNKIYQLTEEYTSYNHGRFIHYGVT